MVRGCRGEVTFCFGNTFWNTFITESHDKLVGFTVFFLPNTVCLFFISSCTDLIFFFFLMLPLVQRGISGSGLAVLLFCGTIIYYLPKNFCFAKRNHTVHTPEEHSRACHWFSGIDLK